VEDNMPESQHLGKDGTTSNPWQRLSRTVVYQNPWIVVYHDEVLRPDGHPDIYGQIHYRNRAVAIVALDDKDRVLLVGQFRYTLGLYSWEIPEGGAAADEELLVAAQRELREETGYSATRWQEIGRAHLSNSVSDEEGVTFLATDLTPGAADPEGTECLQIRWAPFTEALDMVLDGRITDALAIVTLQRVALMRLWGH
jgi:8-oxo-dGTP pyrophosphatase MutT (NUDIX family)